VTGIGALVAGTPAHRVRHIDLLRAVAITAVVLGHWLVMVVEHDGHGRLTGYTALGVLTWAHPVTWLFQVMPVFFMVGGFANAASLSSYQVRATGGAASVAWLLDRSARLVRPTTVLMVVLGGAALLARLLGADPALIGEAVWLASLPLWFLIAYLAMVVLTPLMYALHRRAAGLAVPLLLLVPVAAGDTLRLRYEDEAWAYGSFLFGWLAIHQIGFCWRDRRLPSGRLAAAGLLAGGVAALWLLTYPGPYPVSMVSAPDQTLQNSSPPSLALIALATAQLGLILLVRAPVERWLRRPRAWTVVVAVNSVILTVFLWHMSAATLSTLGLDALGTLPAAPVDSPRWLLWKIPWVMILAVVLAGLVAITGPVETRAATGRTAGGSGGVLVAAGAIGGYAAVIGGLLWQAVAGRDGHGPFAFPTGALLLYLAGAAALRGARRLAAPGKGERGGHPDRGERPQAHEHSG
jgi:hypothetical protein